MKANTEAIKTGACWGINKHKLMRKKNEGKASGDAKKVKRCSNDKKGLTTSGTLMEVYEVERVLKHKVSNGVVQLYYVKWQGWPESSSTWEPASNLRGCLETVIEYFDSLFVPTDRPESLTRKIISLKNELSKYTEEEWEELMRLYFTADEHLIPDTNESDTEYLLGILARLPSCAHEPSLVEEVHTSLVLQKLKLEREAQLKVLKSWENEMNSISTDPAKIKVENSIDLEIPPSSFTYINANVWSLNREVPKDPLVGCNCPNGLCLGPVCCVKYNSVGAYTKNGILKITRGNPIYECNSRCSCDMTCPNRVLQRGRHIPICIFKTPNGCGWGVKTLKSIEKGEFVTEYVGEVIEFREAERRGKENAKKEINTYLFDLDFNQSPAPYTVDAVEFGNASHFINHSCSPNLDVFAVWVDCLDPNLPRLGLYASKKIEAGEELTFDYLCQNDDKISRSRTNEKKHFCRCGSDNCRKFLF